MPVLTAISSYCGINLGGARVLEYAPVSWIAPNSYDMIYNAGNLVYDLTFDTGDWLTMPYLQESADWQESQDQGEQGKSFSQQIQAIVPQLRVEVQQVFEQMSEHRFVVKYTDRNNKVWLIGTPDFGLEFKADGVGGSAGSGLNSYRISFSGITPRRSVGYEPTL